MRIERIPPIVTIKITRDELEILSELLCATSNSLSAIRDGTLAVSLISFVCYYFHVRTKNMIYKWYVHGKKKGSLKLLHTESIALIMIYKHMSLRCDYVNALLQLLVQPIMQRYGIV